jgi:L-threonine kinase
MCTEDGEAAQDFWGWAPGTCGELFQGMIRGRWVQVACPCDRGRWAQVVSHAPSPRGPRPLLPKSHALLERWRARTASEDGGPSRSPRTLTHENVRMGGDELYPGAGLGSSTAELGALLGALHAWDSGSRLLDAFAASHRALEVEPTNGTFHPGLTLFDHREGSVMEPLGPVPTLLALVLVGDAVDTVAFNRRLPARLPGSALAGWAEALALLREGVAGGDLEAVGRAVSASAELSPHLAPRPLLPELRRVTSEVGGLGVIASHSGSAMGVLAPADDPAILDEAQARLEGRFPGYIRLLLRAAPGGIRFGRGLPPTPVSPMVGTT